MPFAPPPPPPTAAAAARAEAVLTACKGRPPSAAGHEFARGYGVVVTSAHMYPPAPSPRCGASSRPSSASSHARRPASARPASASLAHRRTTDVAARPQSARALTVTIHAPAPAPAATVPDAYYGYVEGPGLVVGLAEPGVATQVQAPTA